MEKQTAVDFLVKELKNLYPDLILSLKLWDDIDNLIVKAKQIEKEQIKKAFEMGENTITLDAEEYYNETYLK
jgi:hypothetical protein